MAADLGEIIKLCHGLSSDKVTERKTCASTLRERLQDPKIQMAIDEIGRTKSVIKVSWDMVINAIFGYVILEVEKLKGSKKINDDVTFRKKQEISSIFRSAIQCAEKRGPKLKAGNVYNHIWCILSDKATQKWFCNEYTNVLVKNLLSFDVHITEMTEKVWHDFVRIYCSFITKPPPNGDVCIFTQALNLLTSVAGNMSSCRGKDLFNLFGEVFQDIRDHRNETYVSFLVSALNNFSMHFAVDNRGQLCALGEDLLLVLLPLWSKTASCLKDRLIDFFRIQVDIHHPFGRHLEEDGAWSANQESWKKCLARLQDAIRREFHQLTGKIIWSGHVDLAQKSNFIELAVGAFHQKCFFEAQKQGDRDTYTEKDSNRKRLKTESNWQIIIDGISTISSPTACVAWLQFFTVFLHRYPMNFPASEYLPCLTCLHQAMVHCKRSDVLGFVIRALNSLADQTMHLGDGRIVHRSNEKEIESTWQNVWFETMKAIYSRNINEYGYNLLASILKVNLYTPSNEAYNLFLNSGLRISRDSMLFLVNLLHKIPIPSKPSGNIEVYGDRKIPGKYLVRRRIMEFAIPDIDVSTGQRSFTEIISGMTKESTQLSAFVTMCSLQKQGDILPGKIENLLAIKRVALCDSYEARMKKIEELYVKSSFGVARSHTEKVNESRITRYRSQRFGMIPELADCLFQRCMDLKETMANLDKNEEFSKSASFLPDWLDICCKYLSIFQSISLSLACFLGSSTEQVITGLHDVIQSIIDTAVSVISRMYSKSSVQHDSRDYSVLTLFTYINHFLETVHESGIPTEQFLSLFSKPFMELLFNFTSGQYHQPIKQTSVFHKAEFGSSSGSSTTIGNFDDLMEVNDQSYSQRPISTQAQSIVKQDDCADNLISKSDSLRIEASKLFCHFAFVSNQLHHIKERSLADSIFDFLDEEFDPQNRMAFQILKNVVGHLAGYSIDLSAANLRVVFECIRKYVSDWRNFQSACEESLNLLLSMVKFLKAPDQCPGDDYTQCRLITMKIASVLWSLQEERYCPSVRLMLLKCLVEVMQLDPENVWSKIDLPKQSRKPDSTNEGMLTVEDCIIKSLTDRSHVVRMKAAEFVRYLFQSPQQSYVAPLRQQAVFNKVADALTELIMIKDNLTDYEADDASANRAATLLYVLKVVACWSSVCEKKAIALLFHDYNEKFLDLRLVGKVFKNIAHEKGFNQPVQYLKEHLGFLCNDWIKRGFPLVEFPSSVIGMDTKSFLRYFSRDIIPYVMLYRDQTGFDKIQEKLQLQDPWTELIIENFEKIIVFLLPFYACQSKRKGSEDDVSRQAIDAERKKAKLAYEFLENTLTKEVIDKLIVKRFDLIVVELFLRMFDPPSEDSDASQFMRDTDAAPNPPYFTSFAVRGTLEYLAACRRNKSILEVLSLKKDSIQRILLALSTSITCAKNQREKVRLLCSYRLFVLLLLDDLQNGLGMSWAYFIRDVIYRCCHWLNWYFQNGNDEAFFLAVYHVLQKVAETSLNFCSEELGCHLVIIVNTLTKFAKRGGDQGRRALKLLIFIIIENSQLFRSYLVDLPPFHDVPLFHDLSKKLTSIKQEDNTRDDFDDLKVLYQQEPISIEALNHFVEILTRDKGFIERLLEVRNDGNIVALEIISRLLELALTFDKFQDKDQSREMRLAIARCLGAIGPVDFHSLALPTTEGKLPKDDDAFFESNKSGFSYHLLFEMLCKLLTHERVEIVSAASTALKDALRTKPGMKYLSAYDAGDKARSTFLKYLQPFKPAENKKGSQHLPESQGRTQPSVTEFVARAGGVHLWEPGHMTYEKWVKELSSALISSGAVRDSVFLHLSTICKLDSSFAAFALPLLIHNILLVCTDELKSILSTLINRFVSQYLANRSPCVIPPKASHQKDSNSDDKKKVARMIINVVNHLRMQDRPLKDAVSANTKWDNNFWLDIKYLDLAQMAFECSSYFSAVMFTEIWFDVQRLNLNSLLETEDSCVSSQGTQIEALSDQSGDTEVKTSCQMLLFEAYRSIGEPDAVYGVGTVYLPDVATRVKAYEYEQEFGKALLTQDLQVDLPVASGSIAMAQNLQKAGLCQILLTYMNGMDRDFVEDTAAFEELQFEACWRNGVWDLETKSRSFNEEASSFSASVFDSIVALKEGDSNAFESMIDEARANLLFSYGIHDTVSSSSLYNFLSKMNAISELEKYGKKYFSNDLLFCAKISALPNDFKYYELSLSLRAAALKATLQREVQKPNGDVAIRDEIATEAYSHILRSAVLAREARRFQVCERHLHDIASLESMVVIPSDWKIEQAKMFWDRGEKNRAMYHLKSLIRSCEKGKDPRIADLYPSALGIYGHWLAETRSENPGLIIENYMEHAACLLEDSQSTVSETPSEAYYLLAKYADSQYEGIKEYIKSSAFEDKQSVRNKVKEEMNLLSETGNANNSSRYYRSLSAHCKEDEEELQQMLSDRKQFLQKAVESYVKCLCSGDKYDLRIFRLCSLWLENFHEINVNQIIKNGVVKIESRKFIPLMYQLAARLGSGQTKEGKLFNEILEQLIEKAARDHPYHVTIIIMALCNVEKESEVPTAGTALRRSTLSRKEASAKTNGTDQNRVQSARAILGRLKKTNPSLIESMEIVMNAYIELAYHDIQSLKRKTGKFELPSKLLLQKLKDVKNFPVPTLDIPVDPSCKYKSVTYIASFDHTFTHCGGINLPKVITCIGSDGKQRRQLVKGKDDLRQDAVMQQVFGMVNQLLKKNAETRKRELRIRTYKVVPLSQRSGIVEWCENTFPLGEYLIGVRGIGGAHSLYHPTDWTAVECRKRITEAANSKGKKSRFTVYQEIMKNFRPVFRHFFYEKFADPGDWYTKRLAYTRSLASSSIVGYVVGLGDRHVQNILIDFITAELIHIDLGIAFEQGKQLPTPETIPFRLTRDLVDGMGVAGVEGVFRRCCEKVMELMRNSQEAIQTIVEVLLYDPLYVWTLSPLKAEQVQQKATDYSCDLTGNELQSVKPQTDHSENKMAQRVLIRLRQKLDGNEAGSFLSTEGQVNFLIQSARDPKNLCRVFPGWQPWI